MREQPVLTLGVHARLRPEGTGVMEGLGVEGADRPNQVLLGHYQPWASTCTILGHFEQAQRITCQEIQ